MKIKLPRPGQVYTLLKPFTYKLTYVLKHGKALLHYGWLKEYEFIQRYIVAGQQVERVHKGVRRVTDVPRQDIPAYPGFYSTWWRFVPGETHIDATILKDTELTINTIKYSSPSVLKRTKKTGLVSFKYTVQSAGRKKVLQVYMTIEEFEQMNLEEVKEEEKQQAVR